MPKIGSQCFICDLPVRFDTYEGCSHACRYCFVNRKRNIANVGTGEGVTSLRCWIDGKRTAETSWCDWDIPIHFGGMSDPFQPIELQQRRTLAALQVFAETQYPFIISTKNKLIAEEPYLSLIKQCNVVVQISAACKEYNVIEQGASSFEERVAAIQKITPFKRVIVRIQPYLPTLKLSVLLALKCFAAAGVYGVTIEGMKYIKKMDGTIKHGGDFVYPAALLRRDYVAIREEVHRLGMRFFCAENRLRFMGDDLCCCGVEGMGWRVNTGNLVHMLYDAENVTFTEAQKSAEIHTLLSHIKQGSLVDLAAKKMNMSFEDLMQTALKTQNEIRILIPEDNHGL